MTAPARSDGETHCPECGAKTVLYRHTLNDGLVVGLRALAQHSGPVSLADLGLTYNQRCNFQKLQYWGLVKRAETRGEWEITPYGRAVVDGHEVVHTSVWTYRAEFRKFDGPMVSLACVEDPAWRQKHDYVEDQEAADGV